MFFVIKLVWSLSIANRRLCLNPFLSFQQLQHLNVQSVTSNLQLDDHFFICCGVYCSFSPSQLGVFRNRRRVSDTDFLSFKNFPFVTWLKLMLFFIPSSFLQKTINSGAYLGFGWGPCSLFRVFSNLFLFMGSVFLHLFSLQKKGIYICITLKILNWVC